MAPNWAVGTGLTTLFGGDAKWVVRFDKEKRRGTPDAIWLAKSALPFSSTVAAADAIVEIAEGAWVTPALLWRARETALDYQTAKRVWHRIARYGYR